MPQKKAKKKQNISPEETLQRDLLIQLLSLREQKEKENAIEAQFKSQSELLKGYWDIEKKRYPQYDHCAVIIAEDITDRKRASVRR